LRLHDLAQVAGLRADLKSQAQGPEEPLSAPSTSPP